MLPPLDDTWTWEAWTAAQADTDPLKNVFTQEDLRLAVRRGQALGLSTWQMQGMVHVPERKLDDLLWHGRKKFPHDPACSELVVLRCVLGRLTERAKEQGTDLTPEAEKDMRRFMFLHDLVVGQLSSVTDCADPVGIAKMVRRRDDRISDADLVSGYFGLLRAVAEAVVPFPAQSVSKEPRDVRTGYRGVSSVLDELGLRWLEGYSPRPGGTRTPLRERVFAHLAADPAFAASLGPDPKVGILPAVTKTFVDPPDRTAEPGEGRLSRMRNKPGWDRSAADDANRRLGDVGEEFVIAVERRRLTRKGREDLAMAVRWTARDDGNGSGYDVRSFNCDGTERLIEVKTTNGGIDTPFYLTINEVRVSSLRAADYWLYRVFDFGGSTRAIYTIQGSLDGGGLTLKPMVYRASR